MAGVLGAPRADVPDDVFELSLAELLSIEVTSVSKRAQRLSDAAAAVFVITADDIRRSGVTTIPDSLRLAPGVQVANINANSWAITSRGFNARYANKLLVLIDGRTVYSPLFTGTFWDSQDTVLEDIERIEVVRGPGATLWGSNAVNGVINIITRSAADTQGNLLSAGAGNQERGFASFRHGGAIGENGAYRIYAKAFDRKENEFADTGSPSDDAWDQARIGFRVDLPESEHGSLTIQGDYVTGESQENIRARFEIAGVPPIPEVDPELEAFNLLGRWSHQFESGDEITIQGYYDSNEREFRNVGTDRYTLDLDIDYRTQRFDRHDLLLGAGYRYISDDLRSTDRIRAIPPSRSYELASAFVQDDIALVPDALTLTLGVKFEHNDFTGMEYQPNARISWRPDERYSFWASAARAVRIPGRADHDGRVAAIFFPQGAMVPGIGIPLPLPGVVYAVGSPDFESEELMAYEIGFRYQATSEVSFDVAGFYNDYDSLRSVSFGDPFCEPEGTLTACLFSPQTTNLAIDAVANNDLAGSTSGVEIAANWDPAEHWRLQGNYSYLSQDLDDQAVDRSLVVSSGIDPEHQASLRISYDPNPHFDLDLWFRYTDTVQYPSTEIDAYTAVDARIAWRPRDAVELALVGRNLHDRAQTEFEDEGNANAVTSLLRSVYFQLTWQF